MVRAADRVGRSQAVLSQQVKRLEAEVEQTLMIRSGRGITLTAHGKGCTNTRSRFCACMTKR